MLILSHMLLKCVLLKWWCWRYMALRVELRHMLILTMTFLWIISDSEVVFLFMALLWMYFHRHALVGFKFYKELSAKSIKLKPIRFYLLRCVMNGEESVWNHKGKITVRKGDPSSSPLTPWPCECEPVTCISESTFALPWRYEWHDVIRRKVEIWAKSIVFPVLPRSELYVNMNAFFFHSDFFYSFLR